MSFRNDPKAALESLRRRNRERKQEGIRWPIPGCRRVVHGVHRLCSTHNQRQLRYGSPLQQAIRVYRLHPYRRIVSRFLAANPDHPALAHVYTELARWVSTGAANAPTWPAAGDTQGKLRFELGRLYRGGGPRRKGVIGNAGAREIFEVTAALYLLDHDEPAAFDPHGPTLVYAMARHLLNLRPRVGYKAMSRVTGKGLRLVTTGTSNGVLEEMGRYLLRTLLPVLIPMVKVIVQQREERERRREELLEQ